jgi:hypothetical protein
MDTGRIELPTSRKQMNQCEACALPLCQVPFFHGIYGATCLYLQQALRDVPRHLQRLVSVCLLMNFISGRVDRTPASGLLPRISKTSEIAWRKIAEHSYVEWLEFCS